MGDMSKDAVKLYRPAVHTDGAACMVDCKIGFWVSKPDYDALAAKLAEVTDDCDDLQIALASARKQLERYIGEAEAALASMQSDALAFVLFLDENYRHSFGDIARKKIRAFYARIQTGENE